MEKSIRHRPDASGVALELAPRRDALQVDATKHIYFASLAVTKY